MRITAQSNLDLPIQQSSKVKTAETTQIVETTNTVKIESSKAIGESTKVTQSKSDQDNMREKLEQAVDTMNKLLGSTQKSSEFVLHDGLNKYYVRLVDAKTEEVIKEIPPERLLDAFYEMQKLAGMIVDEKI